MGRDRAPRGRGRAAAARARRARGPCRLGDARGRHGARETHALLFRADAATPGDRPRHRALAREGPVTFARHQGGRCWACAWRARSSSPRDKPEVFTDAIGKPTRGAGAGQHRRQRPATRAARGSKGDAVWGTRARWMALGRPRGRTRTWSCCCSTTRGTRATPRYWHARGYGLFAANPFGPKAFSNGREAERPYSIAAGKPAVFRHRLAVLPGPFSRRAPRQPGRRSRRSTRNRPPVALAGGLRRLRQHHRHARARRARGGARDRRLLRPRPGEGRGDGRPLRGARVRALRGLPRRTARWTSW